MSCGLSGTFYICRLLLTGLVVLLQYSSGTQKRQLNTVAMMLADLLWRA